MTMNPKDDFYYRRILQRLKAHFVSQLCSYVVFGENGSNILFTTIDDKVYGYGTNKFGMLGVGHKEEVTEPTEIVELRGIQIGNIVHGCGHVLVLTKNGEIYAWGNNYYGQIGNNTTSTYFRPICVSNNKNFSSIHCGSEHNFALTKNGQVYAWGRNNEGQLALGHRSNQLVPAIVSELDRYFITSIACGNMHTLALSDQSEVFVWGNNEQGQLGVDKSDPNLVMIRVNVTGLTIKSIACGRSHSLMLSGDGHVYSFGNDYYGQLGSASEVVRGKHCHPVKINSSNQFKTISAHFSSNMSVALSECGFCFVWGELVNEENGISVPRFTSVTSINHAFAYYSINRNTASMVMFDGEQTKHQLNKPIIERLKVLFNDPKDSDLQFIVENKSIYAHRWFLKISSKYFAQMLSDSWSKLSISSVEVNDYSYNIYCKYLQYLYTGNLELNFEEAVEFIDLANSYQENELRQECINIFRKTLSVDNCCRLYQLATRHDLKEFKEFVTAYALAHISQVCLTDGFQAMSADHSKLLLANGNSTSSSMSNLNITPSSTTMSEV